MRCSSGARKKEGRGQGRQSDSAEKPLKNPLQHDLGVVPISTGVTISSPGAKLRAVSVASKAIHSVLLRPLGVFQRNRNPTLLRVVKRQASITQPSAVSSTRKKAVMHECKTCTKTRREPQAPHRRSSAPWRTVKITFPSSYSVFTYW
jgi:hypothetical protein